MHSSQARHAALLIVPAFTVCAQQPTKYPDIPRIDVHAHAGTSLETMAAYMKMRDEIKEKLNADLAMWINLGQRNETLEDWQEAEKRFPGRFVPCLYDYFIYDGLRYSPEELAEWHLKGVAGYKIWGKRPLQTSASYSEPDVLLPWRGVDDAANTPTFTKMEQLGMVAASVDISSPSHPEYPPYDPVKIWRDINAWQRVLDRHPNLKVVNAHMMFLLGSKDQLHYLMYMLERYPNLHVDLAADFQFFRWLDPEVLRGFMIRYADRVLFGTDIGKDTKGSLARYGSAFEILERAGPVKSGSRTIQGLGLPREALEKIYFRNAIRVYDRARRGFLKLGYRVE
jgi:hypothetical protein